MEVVIKSKYKYLYNDLCCMVHKQIIQHMHTNTNATIQLKISESYLILIAMSFGGFL